MANKRRRLTGRVVSDKMDKTVVVEIEVTTTHKLYGKVIRRSERFLAHDESNAIPVGSMVRIVESRPLSRRKRWVVETVLDRPTEAEAVAAEIQHELDAEE
jgi:small subunit ribosomal protein S17